MEHQIVRLPTPATPPTCPARDRLLRDFENRIEISRVKLLIETNTPEARKRRRRYPRHVFWESALICLEALQRCLQRRAYPPQHWERGAAMGAWQMMTVIAEKYTGEPHFGTSIVLFAEALRNSPAPENILVFPSR